MIGAQRRGRRRHHDRRALRDRGPHDDRPRQPHLPVLLDRRGAAGQEVRRRATPRSRSATATRSASSAPSTSARRRTPASPASATTTGSWPTCTSRTTARSATRPSSPTTRRWPAMCTSATGSIVGGLTGVHQFVQDRRARDGRLRQRGHAGRAAVHDGRRQPARGARLQRRRPAAARLRAERIAAVKQMHRLLYRSGLTLDDAPRPRSRRSPRRRPRPPATSRLMLDFLGRSTRGIVR